MWWVFFCCRNELSGALTGLTHVRRFQQDDAYIFCRPDQINSEIKVDFFFLRDGLEITIFASLS